MHLYKKNKSIADYGIIISLVLFAVIMIYFFNAIRNVSGSIDSQQKQALVNAIDSAVVSCYAVEGSYPTEVAYLEEHYGLVYDHDRYYVELNGFGGNIRPAVNVIVLTGGGNRQ